jgi:hypothetical protein
MCALCVVLSPTFIVPRACWESSLASLYGLTPSTCSWVRLVRARWHGLATPMLYDRGSHSDAQREPLQVVAREGGRGTCVWRLRHKRRYQSRARVSRALSCASAKRGGGLPLHPGYPEHVWYSAQAVAD